jgi:hypothetical protein
MTEWPGNQLPWDVGRLSSALSAQRSAGSARHWQYCKYCDYKSLCSRGKMLCRMTVISQARNKLPPRPLSACGNPASRYLVLSESVFVFLCFLCFFFEGYRFLLKFCYVDA